MVKASGCLRMTSDKHRDTSVGQTGRVWTAPCGTLLIKNQINLAPEKRRVLVYTLTPSNCLTTPAHTSIGTLCAKFLLHSRPASDQLNLPLHPPQLSTHQHDVLHFPNLYGEMQNFIPVALNSILK